MIKFKLDICITEKEGHGVVIKGPVHIEGHNPSANELIGIGDSLSDMIDHIIPELASMPGNGLLDFAVALNRSLMEHANKQ